MLMIEKYRKDFEVVLDVWIENECKEVAKRYGIACECVTCCQCRLKMLEIMMQEAPEYLTPEELEVLPIDTPVLVSNNGKHWWKRYYAGNGKVFVDGAASWTGSITGTFKYIKLPEVTPCK